MKIAQMYINRGFFENCKLYRDPETDAPYGGIVAISKNGTPVTIRFASGDDWLHFLRSIHYLSKLQRDQESIFLLRPIDFRIPLIIKNEENHSALFYLDYNDSGVIANIIIEGVYDVFLWIEYSEITVKNLSALIE